MKLGTLLRTWRTVGGTIFLEFFGGLLVNGAQGGILTTLTYGPAIALNASLGNEFVFSITDAVAFVVSNPTNPPPTGKDQVILITYRNISGGAHGAGTFGALYLVSAALAAVATGFSRTIAFRWNGTNWVEVWRTAADVAN